MKKNLIVLALMFPFSILAQNATNNDMDFGPLAPLLGTWKTIESGGVDVAPAKKGGSLAAGQAVAEPFYEVITFEPAADATNVSEQYLVSLYYKQEVFRKKDHAKFHDQRGYLIYDKQNQMVYNSYCIPRGVCIVAEGKAGNKMILASHAQGVAESQYMHENGKTNRFKMTLDISPTEFKYSQTTDLNVYGKPFSHTESSVLTKVADSQ